MSTKNHTLLTVIGDGKDRRCVLCRCECGTVREFDRRKVVSGHTKSCGCSKAKWCGDARRTHGATSTGASRGKVRAYWAYKNMMDRCYAPDDEKYYRYGGRGILVCKRWRASFASFFSDMGESPVRKTLGRVDNDGDYEPGNCRWETAKQQARNRRSSRMIEYEGRVQCLAAWAEELGVNYDSLKYQVNTVGADQAFREALPNHRNS